MNDVEEDLFPELVKAPEKPFLELEDDFVDVDDVDDEPEEPIVPDVKPREKIEQGDIFVNKKVKKVIDDDDDDEGIPSITPIKVKKKRVMSEEHKAKLALAREKALITRRANALKKKEDKEMIFEERELSKLMRRKRISKMKNIVNDVEEPTPVKKPLVEKPVVVEKVIEQQMVGYTEEQMTNAIMKALTVNDNKRKERKAKKQENKVEEEKKKKIFNTINNAVTGNPELDMWSNCFT
tara:strand:- start:1082 stop:1795 length:714 start_codon:yes stop_codon:yes gene_type:complete